VLESAGARVVRPVQPTFRQNESGTWCADLGDGRLLPLPASFRRSSGGTLP
jgi:hypothetical protein